MVLLNFDQNEMINVYFLLLCTIVFLDKYGNILTDNWMNIFKS